MKFRMIAVAWSCTLAWCAMAEAQDTVSNFAREIRLPDIEQEELVAVLLDVSVYDATKSSLTGIRVLDKNGDAVPYLLRRVQATGSQTKRRKWRASDPTVRPLDDGGLEITLKLKNDDPLVDAIRVETPLRNFEHRVRVFSSPDGEEWSPLGNEGMLFDYSQHMDVRNEEINLPATQHRYFRIVVDSLTTEQQSRLMQLTRRLRGGEETGRQERTFVERRPFRIEQIEFLGEVVKEQALGDKKQAYEVGEVRVEEKPDDQQTLVFVNTPHVPLTSFELDTKTRNFSRRVSVSVEEKRGEKVYWQPLSSSVLSRIDFKDLQREKLEIEFPETRKAKYRLVIENYDSSPLSIQGVRSQGNMYQIVLLATPDQQYRLVYGPDDQDAPTYDTVAISAALGAGFAPSAATLGDPSPFQAAVVETDEPLWLRLLRDPRYLTALVVTMVVLLGLALVSASRRLQDMPPEDGKE